MKRLFLSFLLLFTMIFPVSKVHAVDETYIDTLSITCYISEEGSAIFTETWDMYVSEGTEGYKILDNMEGQPVKLLSVTDESGQNYKKLSDWDSSLSLKQKKNTCGTIYDEEDDHYELCFGLGSYGHHQYTLKYRIDHFVNQYEKTQGINYAFFSEMELTINHAEIDLYAKNHPFTTENSAIWGFGYEGTCTYDEDGHIRLVSEQELIGDKMQLLMRIDDALFTSPSQVHADESFDDVLADAREEASFDDDEYIDEDDNDYQYDDSSDMPWVLMCLFGGISAIAAFIFVSRAANHSVSKMHFEDPALIYDKETVHQFRDIPCQKDLLYFYYIANKCQLITEDNRSGIMAAFLLKWINKGYCSFQKGPKAGLLKKHDTYAIDLSHDIPVTSEIEAKLLNIYRQAAKEDRILETAEFERWCTRNYRQVENWFDDISRYVQRDMMRKNLMRFDITQKKALWFTKQQKQRIYSNQVYEDMNQVTGFSLFLKNQDNMKDKEVIDVHLWDEYLIFASVLGIADEVIKQLDLVCPDYASYHTHYNYTYTDYIIMHQIARNFVHKGCTNARSAYHSANSSAYSGGGGHASVGGGGGGFSGGGGGGVR